MEATMNRIAIYVASQRVRRGGRRAWHTCSWLPHYLIPFLSLPFFRPYVIAGIHYIYHFPQLRLQVILIFLYWRVLLDTLGGT